MHWAQRSRELLLLNRATLAIQQENDIPYSVHERAKSTDPLCKRFCPSHAYLCKPTPSVISHYQSMISVEWYRRCQKNIERSFATTDTLYYTVSFSFDEKKNGCHSVFCFSCIFILLSRESDQSAITSLLRSYRLPVCLLLQHGVIPPSAIPHGTSELAGLFSSLSL